MTVHRSWCPGASIPVGRRCPTLPRALRRTAALLAVVLAFAQPQPAAAQFTLPTDFLDEQVRGGLSVPVGMGFLPDGRLFVVEQFSAKVRLLVNGALAAVDPVVIVPNVYAPGGELGLLGIAVDPGWPARPYIYVHYDHTGNHIYISRYTVGGDLTFTGNGALTVDPATRYDILTDLPDDQTNHNGGTLRFGPDGKLYDSLGDDGSGCPAMDLTVLVGKILRLDVSQLPAGGGGPPAKSLITPADNPFVANVNANAKLVAHSGLRNPFRFSIDSQTGALAIGDVGEVDREEVDYVTTLGRNFEWPVREGDIAGPWSCPGADLTYFTEPIYAYSHSVGRAVIGGPIYHRPVGPSGHFPSEYEGDIFFSDFYSNWLRRLKQTGSTWGLVPRPGQTSDWGTGPNPSSMISDWLTGPDGALYYCHITGEIRRIRYTGTSSVPPMTAGALDFRAPYPSPTREAVSLDFVVPHDAQVTLGIFDLSGRRVLKIADAEMQSEGVHHKVWDARDDHGRPVTSGIYLARLTVAGRSLERRIVLLR